MDSSSSKIGFGIVFGGVFLLACAFTTSQAAEIRLKNVPIQCTESLVTLSDIADVLPMGNENVEPLRHVVLFPTPNEEPGRTLGQWEVRTMLSQLGINSLHHSISGAEKVTVVGVAANVAADVGLNEQFVVQANYLTPTAVRADAAPKTAGLTDDIAKILEKQVAQALNVYLNFTHRIERTWDISLKLTPEQVKIFASNGQIVEITGGQMPCIGTQQFIVRMQTNVTVTVEADVKLPTEVVIVRRALPKGHIITESDVMLQRAERINADDFFVDIKSVVGKETVKAVKELSPLMQSSVRLPLWVRRGDIVTVRAVNSGIVVRTEATAMQDGVEGDTITVARIDLTTKRGKKEEPITYLVRVCAPKTVEVFVKN
ncbi:MAG: flagellar basal body P-ring formation chaperone FlgA [Planctomycetaceae bacterium]|jgi:flagella basal body P-ring formation protein FlgA|nr:flagellar basal body P-ring formation chaperone FlgA [Planctomycetaceae bacterium]